MIDFAGEVLILTGPPGSGKTTTANLLAREPGSRKVHLHSDDFWNFIKNGAIAPYLPEANEQNKVVVGVLAKVAEGYANGGYFAIVDGIVGPWFLEPYRTLKVPLHYIVLFPALDVAIQRCRKRGGSTLADPEVITSLYQQLSMLPGLEQHVLRTDGFSAEETASAVSKSMNSGAFRLK